MNENLKVSLENIIPLTYARDHFSQIVSEVQKDKLFVLTKGGKPAVAIIDVKYLESITGGQIQKADIKEEIKKAPEKVGLPSMVEHRKEINPQPIPPKPSGFATPPPVPIPKPIVPPAPQVKPFEPPPSTPLPRAYSLEDTRDKSGQVGTSQGKPAGFAAPRPTIPVPAPVPKIEPQPIPKTAPMPAGPNPFPRPSSGQVPQPKPAPPLAETPKPMPPKPVNMPEPTKPAPPAPTSPKPPPPTAPLVMPKNDSGNQIDIQFSPDEESLKKSSQDGKLNASEKTALDDKPPPAQYAGENDKEPEPEDMVLD